MTISVFNSSITSGGKSFTSTVIIRTPLMTAAKFYKDSCCKAFILKEVKTGTNKSIFPCKFFWHKIWLVKPKLVLVT